MTTVMLSLSMLSDWHVGTGTGRRGFADSLVKRDERGLPFIPAKTITGVWRDACELAAHALDAGPAGPWHDWAEYLFGDQPSLNTTGIPGPGSHGGPRAAALSVRSLHYDPDVADVLAARPHMARAATFLKPGVTIDRATGSALDKQLRYDEMARAGAVLTGTAQISGFEHLDNGQQRCAATLLAVGARLVEGIGGKRRRGTGRCRLDLDGITPDLDWLAADGQPSAPPAGQPAGLPTAPSSLEPLADPAWPAPASAGRTTEWEGADLRLELLTPVVVHDRTVGNAVRSLDYVPGWLLLPEVLSRLAGASSSGRPGDAASAARAGDLIVTNATVELDGRPGRPAPRFLARHRSGSGMEPGDAALCNQAAQVTPAWFHAEPVTEGYVGQASDGEPPAIRLVPLGEYAHNSIDDGVQRPTEAVGGLYMYQAVSPGTVLRAQIRAPHGLLRHGWQSRLTGEWRVGRSSKDDYGRVAVTAAAAALPAVPTAAPPTGHATRRSLRVWLLSDLLVTDRRLRPSSDLRDVADVLGRALGGIALVPASRGSGRVASRCGDRRLESWQRRWGLPRPSLIGIAGGSCLTFDIDGPEPTPEAVRQAELTGIGLRRGEGFGQVVITDPLPSAVFDLHPMSPGEAPLAGAAPGSAELTGAATAGRASAVPGGGAADDVLRTIEEAAWRQAIAEGAESLAATKADRERVLGSGYERVPASQISALRTVTAALDDEQGDRIRYWLDRLTVPGRRNSWPPEVRACLTSLLTSQDRVWELLALPEAGLSRSPAAARDLRAGLWTQAVQAVAAACLTALRRTSGEGSDG